MLSAPNALQTGLNGSKKNIWDSMDELLQDICLGNMGDLSGQVGKKRDVYDTIHGVYEFLQNNDILIWEKLSLTLLWLLICNNYYILGEERRTPCAIQEMIH